MNEEIWRAIVECDPKYDGQIFYGLVTTGIFCKPSCKSKTPKRENVKIFYSAADAKEAGLRPCKRCRPEELHSLSSEEELTHKLMQLINEFYTEPLTLHEMAARLYVSPFYLQKSFKKVMNISPSKYLAMKRLATAKTLLVKETEESITSIAMQVGFPNSSHFASVFQKETGYSPTHYRLAMQNQKDRGKGDACTC